MATSFIDFGIVTDQPEEIQGLIDVFPKLKEVSIDALTFYRGTVPLRKHGSYQVIATFLNRQGEIDAATVTKTLTQIWRPKHLILVGIAGRMNDELQLGDVVASSEVLYYEPAKVTDKGILPRPIGLPANELLLNRMNALQVDRPALARWQRSCEEAHKGPGARTPNLSIGAIASGELLVASEKMKDKIRRLHSRLSAIEMEGAGVFKAAAGEVPPIPAIILRGISDRADRSKNVQKVKQKSESLSEAEIRRLERETAKERKWKEASRLAAIHNASLCLLAFLQRTPVDPLMTDRFTLDTRQHQHAIGHQQNRGSA